MLVSSLMVVTCLPCQPCSRNPSLGSGECGLLSVHKGAGSRRVSCASIVTHCFDEETDECCKNLKARPSLGGASQRRKNSIALELPPGGPAGRRKNSRGSIGGGAATSASGEEDRSRCGSACSQSSTSSALSWTTVQALRRTAAAAMGGKLSKELPFTHKI